MLPGLALVSVSCRHGAEPGSVGQLYHIRLITVAFRRNLPTGCDVDCRGRLTDGFRDEVRAVGFGFTLGSTRFGFLRDKANQKSASSPLQIFRAIVRILPSVISVMTERLDQKKAAAGPVMEVT